MNNLEAISNNVTMSSIDVVELINKFRLEEGNKTLKEHKTLMRDIRSEIEILSKFGEINQNNFVPVTYTDSKGEERPCFNLNKKGIMQMLNKESSLVRYKTQEYIELLENNAQRKSQPNLIEGFQAMATMMNAMAEQVKLVYGTVEESKNIIRQQDIEHRQQLSETVDLIGLRAKNTSALVNLLKAKIRSIKGCNITAKDYHYNSAKERIFRSLGVWLWEEIPANRYNEVHAIIDTIDSLEDIFDI